MPNIENLKRLKGWLEAGAPHASFNMHEGLIVTTDDADPECGTVCCIAGAAKLMAHAKEGEVFPPLKKQVELTMSGGAWWDEVRDEALRFLGLEHQATPHPNGGPKWYGHPLFSTDLAPAKCTPKQAAQAVQNVIDGKEPWEGVV